jgi:hypothetical protein
MNYNILESNDFLEFQILKEYATYLNGILPEVGNKLQRYIQHYIEEKLVNTPEVESMMSGKLRGCFGIEFPEDQVLNFVKVYSLSAKVHTYPVFLVRSGVSKRPCLQIDTEETLERLSLDDMFAQKTEKNVAIYFWNWLLYQGDKSVVTGAYVTNANSYELRHNYSRTNSMIMRKRQASSFRVPPEFSGIDDNNFVSRALQNWLVDVEKFLEKAIR